MTISDLEKLCRLIRYDIVTATTAAGSGHPTSSLSPVELMTTLFFGGFLRYDLEYPQSILNDRVIFSKGHASPLLYSLYQVAGAISYDELLTLRQFDSPLEGHPTPRFKYVDVATGSLGQGLSVGVGMAMGIRSYENNRKIGLKRTPKIWILLGDSEMAEGQIWEAMNTASYYNLNNLVAILDVNRIGQTGETMNGWDLKKYASRAKSFGWETIVLPDGYDIKSIKDAYKEIDALKNLNHQKPYILIAKTVKGKGVSFLEDKDGWHGKAIPQEKLQHALRDIGTIDHSSKGTIAKPEAEKEPAYILTQINKKLEKLANINTDVKKSLELLDSKKNRAISLGVYYKKNHLVATREAFGDGLVELGEKDTSIVVLDAEIANSTYENKFQKVYPERFFEMFIAEQQMVSAATGMAKIGYLPFLSTFAAFITRAFDQIRMAQYSRANLKIVGSHAGISIGPDGPSQMGLEDIAIMRSINESVVLYPSDAISTIKLMEVMYAHEGISYLRATRSKTPILYKESDSFTMGGSTVLKQSSQDRATIIAAGITLHEALKAYDILAKDGIYVAVIDLYSVKPLDKKTINEFAKKTKHLIVVEDHYAYGGIGESVKMILEHNDVPFTHLSVKKLPRSGSTEQLLRYEQIDAEAIVHAVREHSHFKSPLPLRRLMRNTLRQE